MDIQLRTVGPGFVEKQLCQGARLLLSKPAVGNRAGWQRLEETGLTVSIARSGR